MPVKYINPDRTLLLELPGFFTWSFNLYPIEDNHTRLIIRSRWTSSNANLSQRVFLLSMDPLHFVMERRMMHGIKERVEHTHGT